jgi:phosphoribosyl 1,2-cyclic phosphate phosphodiesterase
MEFLLLGSGAAEGWPAPFCACPACEAARARGGANIRSRSGALIDDDLKIDFSPDTVMQLQRQRRAVRGLRTIAFTHEHADHLAPGELEWLVRPFTLTPPAPPVQVFGNQHVLDAIRQASDKRVLDALELNLLRPHESVKTRDGGTTILPLPAAHSRDALVLRIERAGRSIFYGHDSGVYAPATLDALKRAGPLDVALFDCTNGGCISEQPSGHMGTVEVIRMVDELRRGGAIVDRTRCIATHFSHNGRVLHEELVRALMPHGIEAAYDGMVVSV